MVEKIGIAGKKTHVCRGKNLTDVGSMRNAVLDIRDETFSCEGCVAMDTSKKLWNEWLNTCKLSCPSVRSILEPRPFRLVS
ncbi:hypothetical protein POVWA2_030080 [Plasmodium ovale wallikeri]|uniref:Uncharacterized protein n=1 Tax=Plasmodium ovale wallikeri TaxID=864142 RepID=A0A1A8YXU2_PLAOA|nr:hypothetical protein POVWA1_030490 [Plasmodium ovale wallikeri]SBT36424.1 hypothetical protein POVWA2_030080 [Plasmodium ovale wallikeri]